MFCTGSQFISMIGVRIITLQTVTSTSDYLLDILNSGEIPEEGTIVWAMSQTKGRGLGDNTWDSEPGRNLTFSAILYPGFLLPDRQFMLNKVVSLSVHDFVSDFLPGEAVSIKWPNDIYISHGKVAGILIHNIIKSNTMEAAVAGIGLNINQTQFSNRLPNPVSLRMFTAFEPDIRDCLMKVCKSFNHWYHLLREGRSALIDSSYLERLYNYRKPAAYRADNNTFTGTIQGVTEFGRLIMDVEGTGIREFDMKDIGFILPSARQAY